MSDGRCGCSAAWHWIWTIPGPPPAAIEDEPMTLHNVANALRTWVACRRCGCEWASRGTIGARAVRIVDPDPRPDPARKGRGAGMRSNPTPEEVVRAMLLFHSSGPWDEARRRDWYNLTNCIEATTRNLCELGRRALGLGTNAPAPPAGGE
jgi:hypothetical protein